MLRAALTQKFGAKVEKFFFRQNNLSQEIQGPDEQQELTQAEINTMGTKDQRIEVSKTQTYRDALWISPF